MDTITFALKINEKEYGIKSDIDTYLKDPDDFHQSIKGFIHAHTCDHEYIEGYCKHCSYSKQYIEGQNKIA